ncbi:MKRN2 opposite strand protein [Phymastichus coffea]|uniref:MKRN2 opposite strand protein n=1 Tax=Phymastichus coffea TaxID=108790 RepID=UPI00273CAB96|nr:MKRN2 opposite strand protein [Phymastichus coffea]
MSLHQHNDSIICFKHCTSASIFCKKIPQECPICKNNLSALPLDPVIIPYPLTNVVDNQSCCCLVIKPTEGCFLCDYSINDDLHIGVTNSRSDVIEYDKSGLVKCDNHMWKNCVAIQLIPISWQIFWDEMLSIVCNDSNWHTANYNELKYNCFTFVISFLKNINYPSAKFTSKEDLCKILILPKIQSVLKYSTVYRHLVSKDFYIQE